jgi:hypothetical protein
VPQPPQMIEFQAPMSNQASSFVDQIRKKFNDQKYMKREDVLTLLK